MEPVLYEPAEVPEAPEAREPSGLYAMVLGIYLKMLECDLPWGGGGGGALSADGCGSSVRPPPSFMFGTSWARAMGVPLMAPSPASGSGELVGSADFLECIPGSAIIGTGGAR